MLIKTPNLYSDTAVLEGAGAISSALSRIKMDRLLLGSCAPLFYPEAATLKLKESALEGESLNRITHQNAQALLKP